MSGQQVKRVEVIRPFGPFVGKFSIPQRLVDDINAYTDTISCSDDLSKKMDWSEKLVGKTEQEIYIADDVLKPHEDFLEQQVTNYLEQILGMQVLNLSTQPWVIKRGNAWVVRSFPGDFNPMHVHARADICIAGFLKIPDWDTEMQIDAQDHAPARGKLCFMHGNSEEWGNNSLELDPKVGDCYVFPSTLTHFVYPFKTEGERRSFSMNFSRSFIDEKNSGG